MVLFDNNAVSTSLGQLKVNIRLQTLVSGCINKKYDGCSEMIETVTFTLLGKKNKILKFHQNGI